MRARTYLPLETRSKFHYFHWLYPLFFIREIRIKDIVSAHYRRICRGPFSEGDSICCSTGRRPDLNVVLSCGKVSTHVRDCFREILSKVQKYLTEIGHSQ